MNIPNKEIWIQAQGAELNHWNHPGIDEHEFMRQPSTFNKALELNIGDLEQKSILDIGGGPCSILLHSVNFKKPETTVVDPIYSLHPEFSGRLDQIKQRYVNVGITFENKMAEEFLCALPEEYKFDEAWIYNCLQHVYEPEKILVNTLKHTKILRLAEYINCPTDTAHLHIFDELWFERTIEKSNIPVRFHKQNTWHMPETTYPVRILIVEVL
jgi:hypothetical protein